MNCLVESHAVDACLVRKRVGRNGILHVILLNVGLLISLLGFGSHARSLYHMDNAIKTVLNLPK